MNPILRNHSTSDTFWTGSSQIPGPSCQSISPTSHPSVSVSSLHPRCPLGGGVKGGVGLMKLASLGSTLSDTGCSVLGWLVCSGANPLILFSDPLPALGGGGGGSGGGSGGSDRPPQQLHPLPHRRLGALARSIDGSQHRCAQTT